MSCIFPCWLDVCYCRRILGLLPFHLVSPSETWGTEVHSAYCLLTADVDPLIWIPSYHTVASYPCGWWRFRRHWIPWGHYPLTSDSSVPLLLPVVGLTHVALTLSPVVHSTQISSCWEQESWYVLYLAHTCSRMTKFNPIRFQIYVLGLSQWTSWFQSLFPW